MISKQVFAKKPCRLSFLFDACLYKKLGGDLLSPHCTWMAVPKVYSNPGGIATQAGISSKEL